MIIHNPEITGSLIFPRTDGTRVVMQLDSNGNLVTDDQNSSGVSTGNKPAADFSGSFTGSFTGDGSNLTGIAATSFNIDALDALGGASVAQGDNFLLSDAGTEKKVTFSNLEDSVFGNVSGDIAIAAGGAASISSGVIVNDDVNASAAIAYSKINFGGSGIKSGSIEGDITGVTAGNGLTGGGTSGDLTINVGAGDGISVAADAVAVDGTVLRTTGDSVVSGSSQITLSSTTGYNANEHFTQANITTVGTVTSGNVNAILPSGTVSGSDQVASTFAQTILDDTSAGAVRTTIGVDAAGTDNSTDVTLGGSYDYITISGQTITRNQVDASTDISNLTTSNVSEGTNQYYTDARVKTKLNTENVISGSATQVRSLLNVENGATADQTGAEIKTALFNESDTNNLTDTLLSKLNNIESSADVTDSGNVTPILNSVGVVSGSSQINGQSVVSPAAIYDNSGTPTLRTGITQAELRTAIGVDASGTDNSTNVSLAGSYDYITITGQTITRNQITNDDLAGSIANGKLANSGIGIGNAGTIDLGESATVSNILKGSGVVSGSSQVDVTQTTNYSSINQYTDSANTTHLNSLSVLSGSITSADITDVDAFSQSGTYSGLRAQSTTAGDVGLGNVTNESKSTMFTSPTFTGTPLSTTPSANDNSTKIATTAYVQTELTDLIGNAPAAFDTLGEISASLAADSGALDSLTTVVSGKLQKDQNLSDLTNASTARSNLGLGNVENTALSTYTGQGGALDNQYITNGAGYITSFTNTNQLTTFQVEDGDGTEVTISHGKEWKFVEGTGIDINWTNTANGTDADPYDLTITNTAPFTGDVFDNDGTFASLRAQGTTKGDVGLGNVENTALSTYTGNGGALDNQYITNGAGYISSFDITTQTDSKYLRSNASDTASGVITFSNTTASTSITTGAVIVTGGVGISGALNVGGDVVAFASSDERLKDNIELISNPIEKVQSLKGVTWDWNENADELQKSLPNVGVIAQDVEKILPELVTDRDNGFKGVDYAKLTGLLIEAIKEQQKQIDDLKSKLG